MIVASQRPITLSANTTPSGAAGWKIVAELGGGGHRGPGHPAGHPAQHGRARGATITEVAGSHVSMVSHPQVTIDAILAAVAAVGD